MNDFCEIDDVLDGHTRQTTKPNDWRKLPSDMIFSFAGRWWFSKKNNINTQNVCSSSIWIQNIQASEKNDVKEFLLSFWHVKVLGHEIRGTPKLVVFVKKNSPLTQFFPIGMIPPPLWIAYDFVPPILFLKKRLCGHIEHCCWFVVSLRSRAKLKSSTQNPRGRSLTSNRSQRRVNTASTRRKQW